MASLHSTLTKVAGCQDVVELVCFEFLSGHEAHEDENMIMGTTQNVPSVARGGQVNLLSLNSALKSSSQSSNFCLPSFLFVCFVFFFSPSLLFLSFPPLEAFISRPITTLQYVKLLLLFGFVLQCTQEWHSRADRPSVVTLSM